MAASLANATRTDMAQALADRLDGGTIKVYTGAKPASPDAAASGTLLASFNLTNPVEVSVTNGVITLNMDPDLSATAAANGTAGWFRMAGSSSAAVLDGTVGTSGADLNFSATAWVAGGTVTVTDGVITVPAS